MAARGTAVFTAFISMVIVLLAGAVPGHSQERDAPMAKTGLTVPKSLQAEHDAIHSALVEATRAPGAVGTAAKALAEVLHPHFVREQEIALPPLGLLAPLASGTRLADTEIAEALAMTDSLRRELPRMLEEHGRIRAAVDALRKVATAERAAEARELADELALHAQTEEEVLYPAALAVGDLLRVGRGR